jgi:hypothetical protein
VTLVGVVGDGLVLLSNDAPQLLGLGGGVARCCRVARQIGGGSVIDFLPDVNGKVRLICGAEASVDALVAAAAAAFGAGKGSAGACGAALMASKISARSSASRAAVRASN